jgi:cytochrome b involved in lipid metabolism
MHPPTTTDNLPELDAPLDTPYPSSELIKHDGSDPNVRVWVVVKGVIFDVSRNRSTYAPGGSYHIFAGKDVSKAFGKSSLQPEDCIADYSDLDPSELETLDKWFGFFEKRYNTIGKVHD